MHTSSRRLEHPQARKNVPLLDRRRFRRHSPFGTAFAGQAVPYEVSVAFTSPANAVERPAPTRRGFTLVELLVAMSIFAIVTVMTIGAINLGLTGESVRTTARSVQSKLEGARDRAIYNSKQTVGEPRNVGVRLLVDENNPTICRRLVYIQSDGRDVSDVVGGKGVQLRRNGANDVSLVSTGASWFALYDRGLIGPGTIIHVEDSVANTHPLTLHPDSFPLDMSGVIDVVWTDLTPQLHPDAPGPAAAPGTLSLPLEYFIELNPDVLAVEEALELPNGVCIDLTNSILPDNWGSGTGPFSNRMDIMFTAQGPCVGDAATAGIIHLHICDVADALEDTLPGSPTTPNDFDGDGQLDQRHGNELGLTIFGRSGRVISHPISTTSSTPWTANTAYAVGDLVSPSTFNGLIFEAAVAGTTAGTEPTWTDDIGAIYTDGTVTWLARKHDVWEFGLEGEVAR
ncbi:MAG: prepilin-type N-terminal cleavage/methylation domain-containing protein [Planctomycetaceae bacterium]|nr:prepilin-type N-terminal cleavage/methylation domain-containing protein [Planctomycetaceae bacterium]